MMRNSNQRKHQKERKSKIAEHRREEKENIRLAIQEETRENCEIKGKVNGDVISKNRERKNSVSIECKQEDPEYEKTVTQGEVRSEAERERRKTDVSRERRASVKKRGGGAEAKKTILYEAMKRSMTEFAEKAIEMINGLETRQIEMEKEMISMRSNFLKALGEESEKREKDVDKIHGWMENAIPEMQKDGQAMKGIVEKLGEVIAREKEEKRVRLDKRLNSMEEKLENRVEKDKSVKEEESEGRRNEKKLDVERKLEQIKRRLEREEMHRKSKNIIVNGLRIEKKEEIAESIHKEMEINIEPRSWLRIGGREDMIGVELESREEKREIMERKSVLRGSNIYINDDLTWEERKRRKERRDRRRRTAEERVSKPTS